MKVNYLIFLMAQTNIRLRLRESEFSTRGDMKAICHEMTQGEQKELFRNKHVLIDTL